MRTELQIIGLIERYLRNELSKEELEMFQAKLQADESLKKEIKLQNEIVEGIERIALKQDIERAKKKYFGFNKGVYWGVLVIVLTVLSLYYIINIQSNNLNQPKPSNELVLDSASIQPEEINTGDSIQATPEEVHRADAALNEFKLPQKEFQYFTISNNRDTVLKGKEGSILILKANTFASNSNQIRIRLKEYYQMADMVFADLTSLSADQQILETGGMIYLDARSPEGKALSLQNNKEMEIRFPAKKKKADMHLFHGVQNVNGDMVWKLDEIPADTILSTNENTSDVYTEVEIFTIVEDMPIFPGCEGGTRQKMEDCTASKLYDYIRKNVKYPIEAIDKKIRGTVYLRYIIDEKGYVRNAEIVRAVDPLLDYEALRVINSLPKFKPAKQRGREVWVQNTIPIKFSMDDRIKGYTSEEIKRFDDSIRLNRPIEPMMSLKDKLDTVASGKNIPIDDLEFDIEYYAFSAAKLGWLNCDRFNYYRGEKTNLTLAGLPKNARVRIIFHKTKSLISASVEENKVKFPKLPLGERISIFVVKQEAGVPYVCLQEETISRDSPVLQFEKANMEQLKKYASKINEIHP